MLFWIVTLISLSTVMAIVDGGVVIYREVQQMELMMKAVVTE